MKSPKFYGSTTLSDKGQVVIPIEARNDLALERGEKLLVMGMHEDAIVLMKLSNFEKMAGELKKQQEIIDEIIRKDVDGSRD